MTTDRPTCPPWCEDRDQHTRYGPFGVVEHQAPEVVLELAPVDELRYDWPRVATVNVVQTERQDERPCSPAVVVTARGAMIPADAVRLAEALTRAAALAVHRTEVGR